MDGKLFIIKELKKFEFLLDLRKGAINNVLDEIKNHDREVIPNNKLIEIFKIYHN
jgi:hypothetical protein